jgi:phospholipid/cholesterol/gamma-HCH transport system substrate-binding protein
MVAPTSTERIVTDRRKEDDSSGHIGFFTLIAIVLGMLACSWWKGFSLEPPQRFSVLFDDVAGLNVNAPVNTNGMHIGSVEDMHLSGQHQVKVGIKIYVDRVRIPLGSKFTIYSNGVVGAKYIEVLLPDTDPQHPAQILDERSQVIGEQTVRPEILVNKIANSINSWDLKAVDRKLSNSVDSLNRAANAITSLSASTKPVAQKTMVLESRLIDLTGDLRATNRKIDHLLGDPNFSENVKQTAEKIRESSERLQAAMNQVTTTLNDKGMREDIITALEKLKNSTDSLAKSADAAKALGEDKDLRRDILQMLTLAHEDLDSLNGVLKTGKDNPDLQGTLGQAKQCIQHFNMLAEQMNQMMDKRAPLLHLFFGRPGHLKNVQSASKNSPK